MNPFKRMFTHKMTIYKPVRDVVDGIVKERFETAAEDVPCRLSKQTGLAGGVAMGLPSAEEEIGNAIRRFVLFCGEDIEIGAGDRVTVDTGRVRLKLRCAEPMIYDDHMEIVVEERRTV